MPAEADPKQSTPDKNSVILEDENSDSKNTSKGNEASQKGNEVSQLNI